MSGRLYEVRRPLILPHPAGRSSPSSGKPAIEQLRRGARRRRPPGAPPMRGRGPRTPCAPSRCVCGQFLLRQQAAGQRQSQRLAAQSDADEHQLLPCTGDSSPVLAPAAIGSKRATEPACDHRPVVPGREARVKKPLERSTWPKSPASSAPVRRSQRRPGWKGRGSRRTSEEMPYSSVSGTWSPFSSAHPARRLLGLLQVEQARAEEFGGVDSRRGLAGAIRAAGLRRAQRRLEAVGVAVVDQIGLVQDDDVGELDLVHQQIARRCARRPRPGELPRPQVVAARQLRQEVRRVDDGDHGVEPGEIVQRAGPVVAREGEGRGDRHRLGDPGRLDEEIVEAPSPGQPLAPPPAGRRAACSRCSRWSSRPAAPRCATERRRRRARARRRC